MMKELVKKIFFNTSKPNRIFSGVSSGMMTHYDPKDRAMHLLGLYEREIYTYLKKGMEGAETLIDIGANDGYYGLAFVKQKGKEIILCEPGAERKALVENLKLNGCIEKTDFVLIDKFVSDFSGGNKISINDLVKNKNKIFILMDIEGAEQKVVEGFDFRKNDQVIWLIETHALAIEERLIQLLETEGYHVFIIRNAWWRKFIPEKRPLAHNRWLYAEKSDRSD